MKSVDEVADDFIDHLAANAGGYTDPSIEQEMVREYVEWSPLARTQSMVDPEVLASLAEHAGPTLRWLERRGIKFDFLPTAFLTTQQVRQLFATFRELHCLVNAFGVTSQGSFQSIDATEWDRVQTVGRLGTPAEVGAAVAWLCSSDAAFVTGEIIDVNGGLWID